ncbi:hypothetical protein JYU34_015479 [Plutella xylostella]|uniref:Major facilitator superfamily (MFS) profile domain-containing protein n=1 Tax=Plutella xylostella TaxID=51655 RepID=A0ABQ7Q880_PLUXY|nr:hypothetical protein JYU34_015479 [Plutella xylostella]
MDVIGTVNKVLNISLDPVEQAIGRFGRYQFWLLFIVSLSRLPTEFQLNNVVFLIPGVDYRCLDNNLTNVCPCSNPQYDTRDISSSVTTTWNLICDRQPLASLATSALQLGMLVGSVVFGHVSDRYGRKNAIVITLTLEAVAVASSAAVPYFWLYLVLRLLTGVFVGGTLVCTYVYLVELSGKSFRLYLMGLQEVSFVLGYMVVPIVAYYERDWRYLQLVTSVPWVSAMALHWLLPESPRWLITVGRRQEAIDVLMHIASKNDMQTININEIINQAERQSYEESSNQRGSYADLFKTPQIRKYTILTGLIWLCIAHVYFGVNQYIGRLHGNLHINVMLSAASLGPGLILCTFGAYFFSRRAGVIISICASAVSLLLFLVLHSKRALTLAFAIIGEVGAFTAIMQMYMFSSELFPTVIRNSALGFASMLARCGAIISPFVVNVGVEWISVLVFSCMGVLAAVLCCFLPDTKDLVLANSIQEVEGCGNGMKVDDDQRY